MNAKLISIVLALTVLLSTTVGAASATSGFIDPPVAFRPDSPAGSWIVNVTPAPVSGVPPFVNYASLTQDGRLVNSDMLGAVSIGEWIRRGPREYAVTFRGMYQENGQFFSFKVRSTFTLSRDGEEFSGPFTTDIYDANGNPIGSVSGTAHATRMHVKPLD